MDKDELIKKLFLPGSKVIIEYVDVQGAIKNCSTLVEDLEGSYLVLQEPAVEKAEGAFRESQELTIRRLDGLHQEAYVTNVFVIDIRQGKTPLLVCSKPNKIEKTSLRRFSRFNANLICSYLAQGKSGSGQLDDLSLNGFYAVIDPDPQVGEGDVLQFSVTIPGEEDIVMNGKVIRVDQLTKKSKLGLAVDCHEVSDEARETLYNYIFQLQLTADSILSSGSSKKD